MMKRMILIAALAALPAAAQAQTVDWRGVSFVGSGDDEGIAMIDVASIRSPTPTTREVRTGVVNERPGRLPSGGPFSMTEVVYRFDCPGRTYEPLRTILWNERGVQNSAPNDGPVRPVAPRTVVDDIRTVACGGDFSKMRPIEGANPVLPALNLIVQRQVLIDSNASTSWVQLVSTDGAGNRLLYLADRSRIGTDSAGRRYASTMVIPERVQGSAVRFLYLIRIDCRARTAETIYSESYDANGRKVNEMLMFSGIQPLGTDTLASSLEEPTCRNDWSAGTPATGLPGEIARGAFQ